MSHAIDETSDARADADMKVQPVRRVRAASSSPYQAARTTPTKRGADSPPDPRTPPRRQVKQANDGLAKPIPQFPHPPVVDHAAADTDKRMTEHIAMMEGRMQQQQQQQQQQHMNEQLQQQMAAMKAMFETHLATTTSTFQQQSRQNLVALSQNYQSHEALNLNSFCTGIPCPVEGGMSLIRVTYRIIRQRSLSDR